MKRFFIGMLAFAALMAQASSLQAGAISALQFGVVNELEDDNFERFFNRGDDPRRIQPGDRFLGTIAIQAVRVPPGSAPPAYNPGGDDPTFTAVFGLEAAAIVDRDDSGDGALDTTNVYFKPLGTTDWAGAFGVTGINPSNPNTIATFWDDVTGNEMTTSGSLQNVVSSFVGENKIWEFGFAGDDFADDGVSDLGEFFVASGAFGTDVVGASLDTIRNILNLNLLERFAGPALVPHNFLGTDPVAESRAARAEVTFVTAAHLQGIGTIATASGGGAMPIRTDTDLYVQPVPEPSSLAIFAVGAMGLAGYRRRLRRK